jgi:hypothetical protein
MPFEVLKEDERKEEEEQLVEKMPVKCKLWGLLNFKNVTFKFLNIL